VQSITLHTIRDVVQRHLVPDRMAIVAVGEAEHIQKSLEPFGEVEAYPAS